MMLLNPFWLILILPLSLLFLYRPVCGKVLLGLRIALLVLILLALCGVEFRLPSKAGVVCGGYRPQPVHADGYPGPVEGDDLTCFRGRCQKISGSASSPSAGPPR